MLTHHTSFEPSTLAEKIHSTAICPRSTETNMPRGLSLAGWSCMSECSLIGHAGHLSMSMRRKTRPMLSSTQSLVHSTKKQKKSSRQIANHIQELCAAIARVSDPDTYYLPDGVCQIRPMWMPSASGFQ